MAKRLPGYISVRPDAEIYKLTREAGMPNHRAGIRMRVDGKDVDRKLFRHHWLEYYGLAEPAYHVDEDRRRPFLLNFTIDDEDVLTELRKYNAIYSLGDQIEFYLWLERLCCESAKVAYQRIYSASFHYITQIIWLDTVPFAEHPEHVRQLMDGYDLIDRAAERFNANAEVITRVGRPPRFESEEELLREMDASFEAMLQAGCRRITQENIALYMEHANFAPCDADTLSAAIRKFRVSWPTWKAEKNEKISSKKG